MTLRGSKAMIIEKQTHDKPNTGPIELSIRVFYPSLSLKGPGNHDHRERSPTNPKSDQLSYPLGFFCSINGG